MPTTLPERKPPDAANDNLATELGFRLALVVIIVAALMLIGFAVAIIATRPAKAASYGYCQLWARAVTEIEVRTGRQWNLIFVGEALAFEPIEDVDIAVADANLVQLRARAHYRSCRALLEYDILPLPDVPVVKTEVWAKMLEVHAVGRQGTAPATGDAPEGWAEACARTWRTFDPADGTVVRPADKGGKVRCPLVKGESGEWVIP